MFNFFSHSNIFSLLERGIKFINSIFFILLATGLTFALVLSPPDYLQGDLVRIMYIHVPSAWISLLTYSVIAFLSDSISSSIVTYVLLYFYTHTVI